MRALLGLAAIAAIMPAAPVQAVNFHSGDSPGPVRELFVSGHNPGPGHHRDPGRNVRVHHGFGDGFAYAGYNDYGDYDANRSFDPDKWNDWWHDRPDRAYPRWMSRNQDCARHWYSADTLTC